MYKAIFWDFGGVFTTSPFEAFNRYETANGIPIDFIRRVNATNPLDNAWAKLESSRIDAGQFDRLFEGESGALGHAIAGREVLALLSGELRPRMVDALRLCKTQFLNACLTNNVRSGEGPAMERSPERAARAASVMSMFDWVVESSKEGVRKPELKFYELACNRAGVAANEVIFLDDLGVNLKPAAGLGMHTIKVVSEQQALDDLSQVSGLQFR